MSGTLYPGAVDDSTSLPDPVPNSDTVLVDHAGLHDAENAALRAVETKLGTGASTSTAGTVLRGNGTGTTAFGKVVLTTDVSGVLPVANGGIGVGTLTGIPLANGTSPFTAAVAGTDYAGIATVQTLTNTFVQPRVLSATINNTTVTPTASLYDVIVVAVTTSVTIGSPGAGTDGQKQIFRIKDNGTTAGINYNAIFRAVGVPMPSATIPGKTLYIGTSYNATDSAWDVIAYTVQG
jgi:hypothetical protein